jgi:integral membrane protein (TIGR01906 family)
MRRNVTMALAAVIVAATPVVLVGNSLWILLNPWLVEAQYALPGFPDDRFGLGDDERTELAKIGLRSVRPQDEGVELLREARLPDGRVAFDEREIRHMRDVRALIAGVLTAWAIALGVLVAAALALRRVGERGSVSRALAEGGVLAVGLFALVAVAMLVAFDSFFSGFHGVFFEGDSWRFNRRRDTLRQLYPDAFWGVAGGAAVGLVVLQAGGLVWQRGVHRTARPAQRATSSSP